jgi:mRNA interferase MazF
MKRGEIYWLNEESNPVGSEIKKRRPFVVVGANPLNRARRTVLVIPLSRSAKISSPVVVEVFALGQTVAAVCDQIRAADKSRFSQHPEGMLSESEMGVIDASLKKILAL